MRSAEKRATGEAFHVLRNYTYPSHIARAHGSFVSDPGEWHGQKSAHNTRYYDVCLRPTRVSLFRENVSPDSPTLRGLFLNDISTGSFRVRVTQYAMITARPRDPRARGDGR